MSQVRDQQSVARWRAPSPRCPRGAVVATLALAALCACAEGGGGDEELNSGLGNADAGTLPAVPTSSGSGATDTPPSITPPATTPPAASSRSDAGTAASDAGSAKGDAATSRPDASASGSKDAGSSSSLDLDDLLGGLFGDGGTSSAGSSSDGGFTPPPMGGGAWKLDDGSFVDCPPEPPPIPIIGGLCAGVYFTCNWTNQSGEKYFCTCDWVHWLCI